MRLLIQEGRWSQDGLGLLLSRRSCQEVLQEIQIWMEEIFFVQSTWIGSKDITFERKKKRKNKPARLKTQKGDLGKN